MSLRLQEVDEEELYYQAEAMALGSCTLNGGFIKWGLNPQPPVQKAEKYLISD